MPNPIATATRILLPGIAFAAALTLSPGTAAADTPMFTSATTLQLPGLIVAANPANGAALHQPTIRYSSHGTIYPTPDGYGYIYQWTNLSTGASGTIIDTSPDRAEIQTGPGQILITATNPTIAGGGFQTPSIGTFYVAG